MIAKTIIPKGANDEIVCFLHSAYCGEPIIGTETTLDKDLRSLVFNNNASQYVRTDFPKSIVLDVTGIDTERAKLRPSLQVALLWAEYASFW